MRKEERKIDPVLHRKVLLEEAVQTRTHTRRCSTRLRTDAADLIAKAEDSDDPVDPVPTRFDDKNAPFLGTHLRALACQADLSRAEFFEAIARFGELQGWRVNGARDCVRWMTSELGFLRSLAHQELKAARDLRTLPVIAGLFASGKLTWCKVKALLRVATPEDERALAITALDLDADAVQRLCDDYRFGKGPGIGRT